MQQIDAKALDYSPEMKAYFAEVTDLLMERHRVAADTARDLVDRYFALDVDLLERALVMHEDAGTVAADLSKMVP